MGARRLYTVLGLFFTLVSFEVSADPGSINHTWIQEEAGFVRADGEHCCGPEHCRIAATVNLTDTPEGYIGSIDSFPVNGKTRIYDSRDSNGRIWYCTCALWNDEKAQFRTPFTCCLFLPPPT